MKFSEKWLREWVNPQVSTTALAEQLTMAGLEVEGVESCQPDFTGVVVGKVVHVEKVTAADNLSICEVDDGKTLLKVVCGAPNVLAGGTYPFARIGAVLPGGAQIKKSTIKGVESQGMLCSGAELGLTDDSESLMELEPAAEAGTSLENYLQLDDRIIELSLTPNRGDCLSISGIAREIGVVNGLELNIVPADPVAPASVETRPVVLAAPQACPRYVGRVISGINLDRPSPRWLQEKLRRSDIRSINLIVDVTNFVMLELGQPMHAFDLDLLNGGITVRYATQGEEITTLDDVQVTLTADTLVIADDSKAVAMAGIMGGLDSGVTDKTRNIFLESAYFSPDAIMGKPRQYSLHTDSSHRFERGVDFELQVTAIERATQLILDLCGGSAGPVIDVNDAKHLPGQTVVRLRADRINQVLGTDIDGNRVTEILERLGMDVSEADEGWMVKVPSFRFDIGIEADLIEEIARIHGYDRIPTARINASLTIHQRKNSRSINELRRILVDRGYHEAVTYSFVDSHLQGRLCGPVSERAIKLVNPISSELGELRCSLWPGLLNALLYNLKRQQLRIRLFEYGRVFLQDRAEVSQDLKIGGVLCGKNYNIQWDIDNNLSDFYDMKGDIEALIGNVNNLHQLKYQEIQHPALHPGRSAEIFYDNQSIGLCGAIHPGILNELAIDLPAYIFELDCRKILMKDEIKYTKISKYPIVRRDISILVDKDVPVEKVMSVIDSASPKLLNNLELFDVYHGEGIEILKKSLALGLTFQASSNTLTDEEVEGEVEKILAALKSELDGKLRE